MKPMAATRDLFVTRLYQDSLAAEAGFQDFNAELEAACRMLAAEDKAGRAWSRSNGYGGYTSYASLDDLTTRASVFADLKRRLDRRAADFAKSLAFDLRRGGRLKLDSLWVNVLRNGAPHSGHIHPASVISGTIFVLVSQGAGALRLLPGLGMRPKCSSPSSSFGRRGGRSSCGRVGCATRSCLAPRGRKGSASASTTLGDEPLATWTER
jgi:uncharacterized protein (TIGR02466 family)